ncbi:MAG: hypothetical protein IKM84_03835 [Oscillospiraceae bacterium]|nr:hypothetical protein [Oscillospiraceae bacterium]
MNSIIEFGLTEPMHRSTSGDLLGCELEAITDFLNRSGLLVVEYCGHTIIFSHPTCVDKIQKPFLNAGFRPVLLGATLQNIRSVTQLTLAENRVMELLSPGTLLLERDESFSLLIPEDRDLRDIAAVFQGALIAFIWNEVGDFAKLEAILHSIGNYVIGVLKPYHLSKQNDTLTVVKIKNNYDIDCLSVGAIDLQAVVDAANRISVWEVEDWT